MPFLSVSETTLKALNLHRYTRESDDQLINRLMEHARAHMIIIGATPTATEIPRFEVQLQKVLGVIGELEGRSDSKSANRVGAVMDEDLFDALLEGPGFVRSEAARLVGVLMRDGAIYSPRPGYFKRTVPSSPEVGT